MNFADILQNFRRIAIVGMGKNAGKTVALNKFIDIAVNRGMKIGLTSIGRDGERLDIVTATEKPPIYVPGGTILATAEACLKSFTAGYEILDVTSMETAMGRIIICSLLEEGYVEVAGPDSNSEIREVCSKMGRLGSDVILIDGALNRKTQASPAVADAVVLSTGAVVSRDMDIVVQKTGHAVKMLTLPRVEEFADNCISAAKSGFVSFIDADGNIIPTQYRTALGNVREVTSLIREGYRYLVVPGTLMNSMIKAMREILRDTKIEIVVWDGTKVFCDLMDYKQFVKLGGSIRVMESINLTAITLNPYSPEGYYFDHQLFSQAVMEEVQPIDVFDCMQGGE